MSEALIPCPFCGGEAELEFFQDDWYGWMVGCSDCDIWMTAENQQVAIAKWNRRGRGEMDTAKRVYKSDGPGYYEDGHEFWSEGTAQVIICPHCEGINYWFLKNHMPKPRHCTSCGMKLEEGRDEA